MPHRPQPRRQQGQGAARRRRRSARHPQETRAAARPLRKEISHSTFKLREECRRMPRPEGLCALSTLAGGCLERGAQRRRHQPPRSLPPPPQWRSHRRLSTPFPLKKALLLLQRSIGTETTQAPVPPQKAKEQGGTGWLRLLSHRKPYRPGVRCLTLCCFKGSCNLLLRRWPPFTPLLVLSVGRARKIGRRGERCSATYCAAASPPPMYIATAACCT